MGDKLDFSAELLDSKDGRVGVTPNDHLADLVDEPATPGRGREGVVLPVARQILQAPAAVFSAVLGYGLRGERSTPAEIVARRDELNVPRL